MYQTCRGNSRALTLAASVQSTSQLADPTDPAVSADTHLSHKLQGVALDQGSQATSGDSGGSVDKAAPSQVQLKIDVYEVGSYLRTAELISTARSLGYNSIILTYSSTRAPSADTFIADFAIALGVDVLDYGGVLSGDRCAVYQRVIEVAELQQLQI